MNARTSCGVLARCSSRVRILERIGHGSATSWSGPASVWIGPCSCPGAQNVGVAKTSTWPPRTPKMSTDDALPKVTGWSWLPTIITTGMPAAAMGCMASANCFC